MSIITDKFTHRYMVAPVIILCAVGYMTAQECTVQPVRKSRLSSLQTELFVYGSWSYAEESRLNTANNIYTNDNDLFGSFYNAGVNAEFFDTGLPELQYNAAVGYIYKNYFYKGGQITNAGIDSHWLTADLNLSWWLWGLGLMAGVKSDFFLDGRIRNNDHFSYEGLYADCFNTITPCWYAGLLFRLSSFKIEVRFGGYIIPHFDPNRVAYYNLTGSSADQYYFEVRASYRIFTTGRLYKD